MPPHPNRRQLITSSLAAAGIALAGGHAKAAGRTIRIGYQRYGTLILLKHCGYLDAVLAQSGDTVEWSEHPAGPQMLLAMQAGALDFGIVGEVPPVFAQAASDRVVYVGHEPPAPSGEAIIVHADSPIRSLADLKGRSVALNRGSNVHWLLLAALRKAGLTVNDIQVVYLAPGAARPAFQSRRVDAWAIWDPYLAAAETGELPRVLTTGENLVPNRQFFVADRRFANSHPDLLQQTLRQVARADRWASANRAAASAYLAADTGLPIPVVRKAIDRLSFGVAPMTADVVADQQKIADAFHAAGLLPETLSVQAAVWSAPAG